MSETTYTTSLKTRSKDYLTVFSTAEGKRVLKDLYAQCGVDTNPFDRESPTVTAYNSGRLAVGQYIAKIVNQDPAEIQKLAESYQEQINQLSNDYI